MKKTLVAAITSAIVIGAVSTTFAAANPFSDVPSDHWSFGAVAKLAQEGVIEGYGDNTFRGDAHITRYEMAQMVAKAMAKDLSGVDKATVDKLAAEYANELNNLGVRVANLEKKSDNVVFPGEVRFRFNQDELKNHDGSKDKTHDEQGLFRLNVKAQVNDSWTANARLNSTIENFGDGGSGTTTVNRIFVQGPLFGAQATLGKIPMFSEQGYIFDDQLTGAQFQWNGDKLTTTLTAGRTSAGLVDTMYLKDDKRSADYQALDLKYALSPQTNMDLTYNHFSASDNFVQQNGQLKSDNDIWTIAFDTQLSKDFKLNGIYAKSSLDVKNDDGYSVELNYKGADKKVVNSYGVWVAYREVPYATTSTDPTWYASQAGSKGYEVGAQYTFATNILGTLAYFDGKKVDEDDNGYKNDHKFLCAQVQFYF